MVYKPHEMLDTEYSDLLVNTNPADALAPNVVSTSEYMALAAHVRQHALMLQSLFHPLGSSQLEDLIQNLHIFLSSLKLETSWT